VTEILDGWKLGPANPGYPRPSRGHTVAVVSWRRMVTLCFHSRGFFLFAEYATVGYMAKRIQMRKNRFQKIAESMKAASENPGPPRVPGDHGDHAPKQTVSSVGQSAVVFDEFLSLSRRECTVFRLLSLPTPSNQAIRGRLLLFSAWGTILHAFLSARRFTIGSVVWTSRRRSYSTRFLHVIPAYNICPHLPRVRSHAAPESRGTSFVSRLRRSTAKIKLIASP